MTFAAICLDHGLVTGVTTVIVPPDAMEVTVTRDRIVRAAGGGC